MPQPSVPNPAERLARFRVDRLGQAVDRIGVRAQMFRAEVNTTLSGNRPDAASNKALAGAFGAAFNALGEALKAAKAGRQVSGPALDALTGIMRNLKEQNSAGVAELRVGVDQLDEAAPGSFANFCATAQEQIDKLEQFWKDAYKPLAPKVQ
ncbi:hypothetical protein PQR71_35195 [Paraburkholderia fungorum]|uniref:hypothetical protein n=1 Tax=Paraburkholderia fungorum TaxID=134537 RepID=UPI0038B7E3DF